LMPFSNNLCPEEATRLYRWCPDGVTRFGQQIIEKQLEPLVLEREIEVERIRREYYPLLASRYTVVFACREPTDIDLLRWQFFLPNYTGPRRRIWRVAGDPVFQADMNLFKEHCGKNAVAAHAYWSQQETDTPLVEYLLRPPVRVLEEVVGS
jgi:hypothetical protein